MGLDEHKIVDKFGFIVARSPAKAKRGDSDGFFKIKYLTVTRS